MINLIFILKDPSAYCMETELEGGKSESEIWGYLQGAVFGGSD